MGCRGSSEKPSCRTAEGNSPVHLDTVCNQPPAGILLRLALAVNGVAGANANRPRIHHANIKNPQGNSDPTTTEDRRQWSSTISRRWAIVLGAVRPVEARSSSIPNLGRPGSFPVLHFFVLGPSRLFFAYRTSTPAGNAAESRRSRQKAHRGDVETTCLPWAVFRPMLPMEGALLCTTLIRGIPHLQIAYNSMVSLPIGAR